MSQLSIPQLSFPNIRIPIPIPILIFILIQILANSSPFQNVVDAQTTLPNFAALSNTIVPVGVVTQPPFLYPSNSTNTTTSINFNINNPEGFTGLVIDLLNAIQSAFRQNGALNFAFRYHLVPSNSLGVPLTSAPINNGGATFSGLIGELQTGASGLGAALIAPTKRRAEAVAFSVPWLPTSNALLVRRGALETDIWSFVRPFTGRLWGSFLACTIVVGVLSFVFDRLSPYGNFRSLKYGIGGGSDDSLENYTFSSSLTNAMMVMVAQDGNPTRSWSSRLLMLGYFFVCMILISTYTANLAAQATVKPSAPSISTLEQLASSGRRFAVVNGSSTMTYILTAPDPVIASLRPMMVPTVNLDAAVALLRTDSSVAAVISARPLVAYAASLFCELTVSDQTFQWGGLAFPVPFGSTIAPALNYVLAGLVNEGYVSQLKSIYYDSASPCEGTGDITLGSGVQTVRGLSGAFVVLAVFVLIGAIVLLVELLAKRFQESSSKTWRSLNRFFGHRYEHRHITVQARKARQAMEARMGYHTRMAVLNAPAPVSK